MTSFLVVYQDGRHLTLNVAQIITIEEHPDGGCEISVSDPKRQKPIQPDESYNDVMSAIVSINRTLSGPYEQAFHRPYR